MKSKDLKTPKPVNPEEHFRRQMDFYVKAFSVRTVAEALEVSLPTVQRWVEGRNFPHPYMRPGILRLLKELDARIGGFYCNACGQRPCTGKCAQPCEHGVPKREYCDICDEVAP